MEKLVWEKLGEEAEEEEIKRDLRTIGEPFSINWRNEDDFFRSSLLHQACLQHRTSLIMLLLSHPEIEVNPKDRSGCTPLINTCHYGFDEAARILIGDERVDLNVEDYAGCTPLWWASYFNRIAFVRLIVASGRDFSRSVSCAPQGSSLPSDLAGQKGHKEIAQILAVYVNDPLTAAFQARKQLKMKGKINIFSLPNNHFF